jgi:hypothetical protein
MEVAAATQVPKDASHIVILMELSVTFTVEEK